MRFNLAFITMLLMLCLQKEGNSQFGRDRFQNNGIATTVDGDCFAFTFIEGFTGGSVFSYEHIDMNQPHVFSLRITTSCFDFHGDGFAFVFQPLGSFAGSYEQTLGLRGLGPSIAVEIDLEPDSQDNDPYFDHLAIVQDGDLDHQSPNSLAGPVRVLENVDDIEDCQIYFLTIEWLPEERQLDVYFECELRLSRSMRSTILDGATDIHWGVTAGMNRVGPIYTACPDYYHRLATKREEQICRGESVRLISSREDIYYEWYRDMDFLTSGHSEIEVKPDSSTIYRALSLDGCSRKYIEEFYVEVLQDSFLIDLGPPDTILCEGETMQLLVNDEEGSYIWDNGSTELSVEIDQPGIYWVTGQKGDCISEDTIEVIPGEIPVFDLGEETTLCEGNVLDLDAGIGNHFSYRWNDGTQGPKIRIDEGGSYELTVSNRCGDFTDNLEVAFINCFPIYIPNVFSPNEDGINDEFQIYSEFEDITLQSFSVFNRWGNRVFAIENRSFGQEITWDGRFQNEILEAGVYSYHISIMLPAGIEVDRGGTFTIIR